MLFVHIIQTGQSSIASFPVHHPHLSTAWERFFFFLLLFLLLPPSIAILRIGAPHDRFYTFLFPSSQYHTHSVSSHASPLHHLEISTPRFYLTSVLSATSRISTTIMYIHAYTHRIGLFTLFPLRFCLDRRLLHYRIRREYYVVLSLESVSV